MDQTATPSAIVQQPQQPKIDPNEMVTLTHKKTGEVKQVRRSDLPSLGLPVDYKSKAQIQAEAVMNDRLQPSDVKDNAGALNILNEKGYKKKTQKELDAETAKGDTLQKAQAVMTTLGMKNKMSPDDYKTALESAVSSYTASKAFGEGGKNLTGTELGTLAGQMPRIQQNGPSVFDKANEFLTGKKFTPKGELADDEKTIQKKMSIVLKTLDPKYKDRPMPDLSGGPSAKPAEDGILARLGKGAVKNVNDIGQGLFDTAKNIAHKTTPERLGGEGKDVSQAMGETAIDMGKGLVQQIGDIAPINNKGQFDIGKTGNYIVDNPVNTAMLLAPTKGLLKGLKGESAGAVGAEGAAAADSAMPNMAQNVIRNTTDLVNGGGSKEYIARQAKNPNALPQNQVLLEDGVLGHPTETGKIQASAKAQQAYGQKLGDIYKSSDKVFKGNELGGTLDTKLKDMGYDPKAIRFIKNYVQQQGSFDLSSGDNLITMEKAWQSAQKLEKNPPKMLKNPESSKAFKQLSLDTAKIIRNELGRKLPETKPINARYSAHADYMENGLQDPQGLTPTGGGIVNGVANAGKALINPALQAGYKAAGMMPNMAP